MDGTIRQPAAQMQFLADVSQHLPRSRDGARYIVGVDFVGRQSAQCIKVEHPSHLYVTDNFIVTHNTGRGLMLARLAKATGQAKKPTFVVPKSVLANWVIPVFAGMMTYNN